MAKKKTTKKETMMQAKVVEIRRHDEGVGVALNDGQRPQSFVIYFEAVEEDLDVGDLVTVTIIKRSEV